MLHQVLLDDRLHRDACRGRRERVAAIARRAAARVGPGLGERDLLAGDHAAQREAAAEALPHRENVRQHALVLDREHPPRAPEASDHLVADEERAQLVGQLAQLLQVAGGRDHVAGGALDRLHQDRGHVLRGLDLDLLPQELDAVPLARRERLVERAARAPGVGREVSAGHQRPERMLEARAEHRQHAAGLAVEAAPEADHLGVPGAGLGEPQGRLDRLRPARVELRAVQIAGRELGEQFDERRPVLRREAADVDAGDLALQRRHVLGVRVPHADPREQVDVAVPVDVVQHGPFAAVDRELAEQRHALGARSEVAGLGVEQRLRLGPGDLQLAQGMGHEYFRCAKR